MNTALSENGKAVLMELLNEVVGLSEDARLIVLGYATALNNFGIGKDGAHGGQKES